MKLFKDYYDFVPIVGGEIEKQFFNKHADKLTAIKTKTRAQATTSQYVF